MRKLVATVLATAVCGAAAGCTTGRDQPAESPSPTTSSAPPSSGKPVTLRFAVYGDKKLVKSYTDLAEAFTEKNPRVRVAVEHAPDATTFRADLRRDFVDLDAPDVFLAGRDQLPSLVADKRLQPVDELLEERQVDFGDGYQREGLEAFSADSALQCMPYDVSSLVVYYNSDLLTPQRRVLEGDEQPPSAREGWSWEQFSAAARRVANGSTDGVHIDAELQMLAPFLWSAGADIVDDPLEPTSLAMSEANTRAALEEVLALVRDADVTPALHELDQQSALSRFKQGRLAMILGTRALTPSLRAVPGLGFDVFPLPHLGTLRTVSSFSAYCISSGTEHVQEAADFLAFAVSRKGATITSLSGYLVPSNVQVVHSSAFSQPAKQPENAFVFSEGVRRADETPFVEEWAEVEHETRPLLKRMFYAPVIDLESLLLRVDARSQTILAPEVLPEEQ
ncbi:MAG: extracellular solute-binding protein [Actinomycetota bacterium]|nr:extracellular solute-binding protein [Actinomycetota bacterium]